MSEFLVKMLADQLEAIADMATEGIMTDGCHHKQWYLQQILLASAGPRERERRRKKYIEYEWDEGTPP